MPDQVPAVRLTSITKRFPGVVANRDINLTIERGEVAGLPPAEWSSVIIATGPLTSPALAEAILSLTGEKELAFFFASAELLAAR